MPALDERAENSQRDQTPGFVSFSDAVPAETTEQSRVWPAVNHPSRDLSLGDAGSEWIPSALKKNRVPAEGNGDGAVGRMRGDPETEIPS